MTLRETIKIQCLKQFFDLCPEAVGNPGSAVERVVSAHLFQAGSGCRCGASGKLNQASLQLMARTLHASCVASFDGRIKPAQNGRIFNGKNSDHFLQQFRIAVYAAPKGRQIEDFRTQTCPIKQISTVCPLSLESRCTERFFPNPCYEGLGWSASFRHFRMMCLKSY